MSTEPNPPTITVHDTSVDDATAFEFAASALVRGVEVAAIVLVALLVCPPLFILVVVVAVPVAAIAAVFAVVAGVISVPFLVARHLRGRRAHHTHLLLRRLRPRTSA